MAVKSRREEYAATTRRAILVAARKRFARHGYTATSVDEIAAAARVTKGAVYHHFASKQNVFEAVFEQLEEELVATVVDRAGRAGDVWEGTLAGVDALLDACLEPTVRRIALQEAPAALGWTRYRELEARHSMGVVRAAVEALVAEGFIAPLPTDLLAAVVFGGVIEAALAIGEADDPRRVRRQAGALLHRLLAGLRPEG